MKIVAVPYSGGSLGKNKGCEQAPSALITALLKEKISFTLDQANVTSDDVESLKNLEHTPGDIYIGGDHSLTYYTFKTFSTQYPDVALLVFDAHPDCYDKNDLTTPLHEDYLYHLIENNHLKPEHTLLIGPRTIDKREMKYLKKKGITFYTSHEAITNLKHVSHAIFEFVKRHTHVYVSIDIDVIDPTHAPGTGYPEPQGLGKDDLFSILRTLTPVSPHIQHYDLVEINPTLDTNHQTITLGVDILKTLLTLHTL